MAVTRNSAAANAANGSGAAANTNNGVVKAEAKINLSKLAQLSCEELEQCIRDEQLKDLDKRRLIFRQRKQRQPTDIDETFTNAIVKECRRLLAEPMPDHVMTNTGVITDTDGIPLPVIMVTSQPGIRSDTDGANDNLIISLKRSVSPPIALHHQDANTSPNEELGDPSHQPRVATSPPAPASLPPAEHNPEAQSATASTATAVGIDNGDKGKRRERKEDEPRPGALTKEQLRLLRDKNSELEKWIADKAREWNVSNLTIISNMGIDNRERRARNFWNIFQTVFWSNVVNEHERKRHEDPSTPDLDGEAVARECHDQYATLKLPDDQVVISEDEVEEINRRRQEIVEEYERMEQEEELRFREGNTAGLMRQARRELSLHAQWFALRGVLLAGFGVSIDYLDPISHTLNFSFAGNDNARKFFDDDEINMTQIIYDFETYCREGELKDRHRGNKHRDVQGALRHAMETKSGDKRKSAISEMLRRIWSKCICEDVAALEDATGLQATRLRWDEWADDFIKKHHRLVGWPADVTWPSGPAPYGSIDRGRSGKLLGDALLAEEGRQIRAEPWTKEEIKLANSAPRHRLMKDPAWLCIPIIVDQDDKPLLTIGQVDEQTVACANYSKNALERKVQGQGRKRKAGDGEDESDDSDGEQSADGKRVGMETDDGGEEVVGKRRKGKKGKKVAKAHNVEVERSKKVKKPKTVSKEYIEDSDHEEIHMVGSGEGPSINTGAPPQPADTRMPTHKVKPRPIGLAAQVNDDSVILERENVGGLAGGGSLLPLVHPPSQSLAAQGLTQEPGVGGVYSKGYQQGYAADIDGGWDHASGGGPVMAAFPLGVPDAAGVYPQGAPHGGEAYGAHAPVDRAGSRPPSRAQSRPPSRNGPSPFVGQGYEGIGAALGHHRYVPVPMPAGRVRPRSTSVEPPQRFVEGPVYHPQYAPPPPPPTARPIQRMANYIPPGMAQNMLPERTMLNRAMTYVDPSQTYDMHGSHRYNVDIRGQGVSGSTGRGYYSGQQGTYEGRSQWYGYEYGDRLGPVREEKGYENVHK
ncbi:hypothetical protein M422DRAFT_51223 [Sphaerobolus stellatus SS14]|uniref:Unplaced genomic scaffold SPHSTscaffold_107, whole genome shotgun sequence n=1 Tax=Sphaerobolus stellatus (strain SS14) TaxID=990650 RepID=A0A0C9VF11_SPHS4|nr:hypothetical protein M422DRAFT_51223 [Sphaerobolus stellatus SS14]